MPSMFRVLLHHPSGQEEEVERFLDYSAAVQSALELQLHVIEDLDRRRYLRGQVIRLHNPYQKLMRIQKLLKEVDPSQNYATILIIEDNTAAPITPMVTETGRPLRRSAAIARAEMTNINSCNDVRDNDSSADSNSSSQQDDDSSSSSSSTSAAAASDSDFQQDDDDAVTTTAAVTPTPSKSIPPKVSGVRTRRQRSELMMIDSDGAAGANIIHSDNDGHWRADHWDIKPQREPLLIPFPDDGTHLIGRARWYRRTW